jgi:hypothetical protein
MSFSYGTGGADLCIDLTGYSDLYRTIHSGRIGGINVSDGLFVFIEDEDYKSIVRNYGGTACVTGNAPGTTDTTETVTERGSILYGTAQQDFDRIESDTSSSVDGLFAKPFSNVGIHAWNPGDPDPFVFLDTSSSDKYNRTGYKWLRDTHISHFIEYGGARDHNDRYLISTEHQYNLAETDDYWDFLTGGDLATLDELDNGTGTVYFYPHVAN